jgi:hypothetical protein
MVDFIDFDHLTDLERKIILLVFRGWKIDYLKSLKFKKAKDGWMVRDDSLNATQYMHFGKHKT